MVAVPNKLRWRSSMRRNAAHVHRPSSDPSPLEKENGTSSSGTRIKWNIGPHSPVSVRKSPQSKTASDRHRSKSESSADKKKAEELLMHNLWKLAFPGVYVCLCLWHFNACTGIHPGRTHHCPEMWDSSSVYKIETDVKNEPCDRWCQAEQERFHKIRECLRKSQKRTRDWLKSWGSMRLVFSNTKFVHWTFFLPWLLCHNDLVGPCKVKFCLWNQLIVKKMLFLDQKPELIWRLYIL